MTNNQAGLALGVTLWAAIFIVVCGQTFTAIFPLLLGSLVDGAGLSVSEASDVLAAGTGGLLMGTAFMLIKGHLWDRRLIGCCAFGLMLAGNSFALFFHQYYGLLLAFCTAGYGAGTAVALGMAVLAAEGDTAKRYGIMVMTLSAFNAAVLLLIPQLTEWWGFNGVIAILTSYSVLGFALLSSIPRHIKTLSDNAHSSSTVRLTSRSPLLAVTATLILFTGFASFWPYIERIAVDAAIAKERIALSYSLGMVGAGCSGVVATVLGERFGFFKPLMVCCLLLFAGAMAISFILTVNTVVILVPLFQFSYVLMMVFNNAALAKMDASGRVLVFGVFVESTGWFLGPLLAGQVFRTGGSYFTLACIFIGAVGLFIGIRLLMLRDMRKAPEVNSLAKVV